MSRWLACVGDSTTTNGTVLEHGAKTTTLFGKRTAIIGGDVSCPACNSTGQIQKAGGGRRLKSAGKEVALHDDIVVCGCPTPPKVIAGQQKSTYTDQV
ncbi:PAAR motif-containing protein [Andreprevotia lacus DSM 23236]|uniref:PAAR motif-containing protein n=1 Tax=Andreprevotia lacus DSM 23236 TaxID=1121001 RepID=A0A1W1Y0I2_9NEIS|nr:PAAR domain-containing protein [Andreprevotia lacus]SMC29642.1 PAAR motif-containing protein [Andreprevotia lacus DSM 23236]